MAILSARDYKILVVDVLAETIISVHNFENNLQVSHKQLLVFGEVTGSRERGETLSTPKRIIYATQAMNDNKLFLNVLWLYPEW